MLSVLVAVAASNGDHHPKVTRSMFSHPAMGDRHWRRPLQNITVQAEQFSGTDALLNHAKLMEEDGEDRQRCHETHQKKVDAKETLRDGTPVGELIFH